MRDDRIRIVLDNSMTEDNLDPFFGDPHNWMIKERYGQNGDRPREYIYGTEDLRNNIHFIMDHKIGVKYLLITGPEAKQIEEYVRQGRGLRNWHSKAIMERALKTNLSPEDRRQVLYHLALDKMDHGFDQETFDIYCKALKDPDSYVRASALLGSAYLAWTQLADPIRPSQQTLNRIPTSARMQRCFSPGWEPRSRRRTDGHLTNHARHQTTAREIIPLTSTVNVFIAITAQA